LTSDFIRERSARAESEAFTLDKLRHRGRLRLLDVLRRRAGGGIDFARAAPRLRLTTIVPRELTEYAGVPIFPPVRLGPGCSVELWWHIEAGVLTYRHEASDQRGAQRQLLQLLIARAVRLCALEVLAEFGVTLRRASDSNRAIPSL